MADNFEQPGQDPMGGSPPGEPFPADYFDDSATPSAGSLDPKEPPPAPRPAPLPPMEGMEGPPLGPPYTYRPPDDAVYDDEEPAKTPFPAILGALMAVSLVVAVFLNMQKPEPVAAATTPTPSSIVDPPAPAPAAPTVALADFESLQGTVKALNGKVEALTAELKAYDAKLKEMPKSEPAPDIKPIEDKIGSLGKTVAVVGPLSEKVKKVDEKVGSFDGDMKSIKGEIASLRDELHKLAAAPPTAATPAATSEPKPEPKAAADDAAAMTGGVDLFKAGKYKEAEDVFKKLATANAKDARVYYYAALTHGLNSGNWQGDTLSTAAKGAELEKAGSPKASEIDSTFADLPSTLKPWIAFFRQQAK